MYLQHEALLYSPSMTWMWTMMGLWIYSNIQGELRRALIITLNLALALTLTLNLALITILP